jgi:hypothetical protein
MLEARRTTQKRGREDAEEEEKPKKKKTRTPLTPGQRYYPTLHTSMNSDSDEYVTDEYVQNHRRSPTEYRLFVKEEDVPDHVKESSGWDK